MGEEQKTHETPADALAPEERRARAELVERLFREHNSALVRFLQARLRSPQEAHEVAQEAYVRLLSLDEPGAVSYLRAFLFKTAANLAVDRLRREDLHLRVLAQGTEPLLVSIKNSKGTRAIVAGAAVELIIEPDDIHVLRR